jgi:hypothetical protein
MPAAIGKAELPTQIATACGAAESLDGGRGARHLAHYLAEGTTSQGNLADAIRRRFEPLRGVDLALPPRGSMREPSDFK